MARGALAALALFVSGAALFAPGAMAQVPEFPEDFQLDAANTDAVGVFFNSTHVYVVDEADTYIYAYNRATNARDMGREINLHSSNDTPGGMTGDGTNLYVLETDRDRVHIYNIASRSRTGEHTLFRGSNYVPHGVWSDGTGTGSASRWIASDPERDSFMTFNGNTFQTELGLDRTRNNDPRGIWSDGSIVWVVDRADRYIYAYNINGGRNAAHDIALNTSAFPSNPTGIWGSGGTTDGIMLVVFDGSREVRGISIRNRNRLIAPVLNFFQIEDAVEGGLLRFWVEALDRVGGNRVEPPYGLPIRWETNLAASTASSSDVTGTLMNNTGCCVGTNGIAFSIQTVDDAIFESPETVVVDISGITNARLVNGGGTTRLTATINDNDGVSVNDPAAVTEGGAIDFEVTLGTTFTSAVVITYATENENPANHASATGAATASGAGSDYTGSGGDRMLTFPAGQTSRTVTIQTTADTRDDFDTEIFALQLKTNPDLSTITATTDCTMSEFRGCGLITDDDAPPFIVVDDVTGDEGSGSMQFVMRLVNATGQTVISDKMVSVSFQTAGGTATSGTDFTARSGSVTFTPGTSTITRGITPIDDSDSEPNETFTLQLSSPMNASFMGGASTLSATGTITDNDLPLVSIGATRNSVNEGEDVAFVVQLSVAHTANLDVPVTLAENGDYLSVKTESLTITIPAGGTSATSAALATVNDDLDETDGTLTATIGTLPATHAGAGSSVTVNLRDDDATYHWEVTSSGMVTEGGSYTLAVTVTPAWNHHLDLILSTDDTSSQCNVGGRRQATRNVDYSAADLDRDEELFFDASMGQTSMSFNIPTHQDAAREGNEFVPIYLYAFDYSDETIVNNALCHVLTIVDDELPVLSLAADAASITEGAAAVFTVSLSEAHTALLRVPVTLSQSGRVAAADALAARTVDIPAGETEAKFTVATAQDNTDEADGSVTASFGALPDTHRAGSDASASATVTDDEDPPVLAVAASSGPEGEEAVFTVTLSPAMGEIDGNVSDLTVRVAYDVAARGDDTGMAGEDFAADMGNLVFEPGDTEQRVTVDLLNEDDDMQEETFTFSLSLPSTGANAVFAGGGDSLRAPGTVQELPSLMIAADDADGTVSEAEAATFTVSLSRVPNDGAAVVVPVSVATTGNLHGALPDSVTIAAGALSAALNVPLDNDSRDEEDGSITVTISLPAGREDDFLFRSADLASAMLSITDDDEPPSVSVLGAATVLEGETLVFPVRLSGPSERGISVIYTTADAGAAAGADYQTATGLLSFAPGATELPVEVVTLEDTAADPNEKVAVVLSEPVNAALGAARAEGTIIEGLSDAEIQALNEAIIPHVITALNEETTGAIQDRVRAVFDGTDAAAEGLTVRGSTPGQFLEGLIPGEVNTALAIVRSGSADPADRHSRESGNLEQRPGFLDSRLRGNDGGAPPANRPVQQGQSPQLNGWGDGFRDWSLPQFSAADFNFNASLNADGGGFALPPVNVWGRGYYRDLSVEAEGNPISFEGDILGFILGADARFTDAFLAGISLNHTRADMDWDNSKFTGAHETALTSIHPYAAWRLDSGLLVWSSLGYGEGDLELTEDGNAAFSFEHDVSVGTAAIGGYGPLPSAGPVDFGIIADAAYARTDGDSGTPAVESGWLRAGVEADYDYGLPDGSALSVKGELALRGDFGDAKSGGAVELASQFEYRHPLGIRADLKARALLSHEDDEVEEWGISGGVAYTTPGIGGFAIAFSPEWGITHTARDRLLNGGFAVNPLGANHPPLEGGSDFRLRYNLEMQYAIPVMQGRELLTLFARSDLRSAASNYALGANLKLGEHFSAGYESTLNRRAPFPAAAPLADTLDHRAYIRFERRF